MQQMQIRVYKYMLTKGVEKRRHAIMQPGNMSLQCVQAHIMLNQHLEIEKDEDLKALIFETFSKVDKERTTERERGKKIYSMNIGQLRLALQTASLEECRLITRLINGLEEENRLTAEYQKLFDSVRCDANAVNE